jgi:hypothetical protein
MFEGTMDTPELVVGTGKDAEYYREQARETIAEVRTATLPESKALLVSIADAYEQLAQISELTRDQRGNWELR